MWSFFSRDPSKDFAYEVGEKVSGFDDRSIWSLHEGKHKGTGQAVSIFAFDIKSHSESQVQLAKNSFKRIKTLRHPNILTYLDGLESEKVLYFATEAVQPLDNYLKSSEDRSGHQQAISWGLHQIAKGLSFLVNDCNLTHNNVCLSSVFVDQSGEWKLGGVDYMYPAQGNDSVPPVKILPALEKYDPPEKSAPGRKPSNKWSIDSWGLGCLIWEIFNGHLNKTQSLKTLGKIPKTLVSHYCELVGANPKSRPNPGTLIDNCRSKGGFMDNKFIETMLFLEEIQIKDAQEKTQFFNSLAPVLDTFPPEFCKNKILPQLLHAFEYGNAGSAILTPLFKLGKALDTVEYQKKIVPIIVKLFGSTDRATRVKLLQQIEEFVVYLSPDVVNTSIFPNVIHGFSDTNPVVREHSIKSMLHLAEKLNYKNLNEELLKQFARLQTKDDQGGIRTNTTVCLGKIACHLNPQVRQRVLCSAYSRAMKDPFPPARQASVLAMAATHNFFTLQESATKLLPILCSMSMDPEKSVRDQVFKAIKCFLAKLEKVSENPELQADLEKDVSRGGSAASQASGWTGWAAGGVSSLTSLGSKFYKGKGKSPPNTDSTKSRIGDLPASKPSPTPQATPTPAPASSAPPVESRVEEDDMGDNEEDEGGEWGDDAGWEDDGNWGSMDDAGEGNEDEDIQGDGDGGGWDDNDDWGSLDDTQSSKTQSSTSKGAMSQGAEFTEVKDVRSAASFDWGSNDQEDDFFSSAATSNNSKKNRPSSASSKTKSQAASSNIQSSQSQNKSTVQSRTSLQSGAKSKPMKGGDGWGDEGWEDDSGWGGDDWGSTNTGPTQAGMSKAEEARLKREERKAQRQKELDDKRAAKGTGLGAMKLGARKVAKD